MQLCLVLNYSTSYFYNLLSIITEIIIFFSDIIPISTEYRDRGYWNIQLYLYKTFIWNINFSFINKLELTVPIKDTVILFINLNF